MKRRSSVAMLATAAICCSLPAVADVVYNSFGPGNNVQNNISWQVNAGFVPTVKFTSYANYRVSEIDVSLANGAGVNKAIISLLKSASDGSPGDVIGTWNVANQPPADTGPVTHVLHICGVYLATGQNYFLRIAPGDQSTFDSWTFNNDGALTTIYNGNTLAYSSYNAPAFDVIGIALSHPADSSRPCS